MRTSSPYLTTEKAVGETPLVALERLRIEAHIDAEVALAYAGRLDPMASGKLLILVGDECKIQEKYHSLDKEYEFEVLLGVHSDSGDILGMVTHHIIPTIEEKIICSVATSLTGEITLPYPHFSSKTVQGKPLHTWTLEGRLDEITIPTKTSAIHSLTYLGKRTINVETLYHDVCEKIDTIPSVTDARKALGADFRRMDVREGWKSLYSKNQKTTFVVLRFICVASSGTYMRTLAEIIGEKLETKALAYSIHRTKIGKYLPILGRFGVWTRSF